MNNMIDFKELLEIDEHNIQRSFDEIAAKLLRAHKLIVNSVSYDIIEIEFFYWSTLHKDNKVIYRDKNAGDFFFHDYGVDLCFQSKSEQCYGGILFRSIKSDDFINGPLKVQQVILNNYDSEQGLKLNLTKYPVENQIEILKSRRIIVETSGYDFFNYPYRYAVLLNYAKNKVKNKNCFPLPFNIPKL